MTRRARIVVITVLGAAFISLGVLPLLFLTLPNPGPMSLTTLEGERVGTYVDAANGFSKMFPFAEPATSFPPNVSVTTRQSQVYVRYRQMDVASAYSVHAFESGREISVEKTVRPDRTLVMKPVAPLSPGRYYAVAARDGIYGGTDYFYFRVTD
jgi:hypothetical protein